jgi:hypothetical protein
METRTVRKTCTDQPDPTPAQARALARVVWRCRDRYHTALERRRKWYVIFACAGPEPVPLPASGQQVGIDVGLATFATLSSG